MKHSMQKKNTYTYTHTLTHTHSHSLLFTQNTLIRMRAIAGGSPFPLWYTDRQAHMDRIPGVQSDSSEPEGTKTFTWSLSSPWRQQVKKLHKQRLRNHKYSYKLTLSPFLLLLQI